MWPQTRSSYHSNTLISVADIQGRLCWLIYGPILDIFSNINGETLRCSASLHGLYKVNKWNGTNPKIIIFHYYVVPADRGTPHFRATLNHSQTIDEIENLLRGMASRGTELRETFINGIPKLLKWLFGYSEAGGYARRWSETFTMSKICVENRAIRKALQNLKLWQCSTHTEKMKWTNFYWRSSSTRYLPN
jgi:hypothetical protein